MKNVKVLLAALAFTTTSFLLTSCGGGGGNNASTVSTPAPTATLSASQATITQGDTVALTVTTKNATTCTASASPADSAWTGSVPCNGSQTIKPTVTGKVTYSVAAEGSGGSATASATVTVNATTPVASLSPTSLDFGSVNVSVNVSKTVALTNTGSGTLDISGIGVAGTNASDFTQTNNCGASLAAGTSCNVVVDFAPSASGTLTASLAIADNAAGNPQSVSLSGTGVMANLTISPTSATVLLGAKQLFTLNADATANSALFGSMPVTSSGSTFTTTYTVPQALPSTWNDTLTGTATAGGSQASAQITLQYPVPVITGTSAPYGSLGTIFLFGPAGTSFFVNGSGFLSDGNFNPSNDAQDICGASVINWGQLQIGFSTGYTDFGVQCSSAVKSIWDPGFINFTASDPATGHGGGTSNVGRLAFLGDQNQIAVGKTDTFFFDPATSTVYKQKLSDGTMDGTPFTVTPGTILAIGTDNTTTKNGIVIVFTDSSTEAFDQATNAKLWEIDTSSPGALHGGTAGDGWAVLSSYDGTQGLPNVLDAFNLQQPGSSPIHVSVKDTPQNFPWDFQITTLNGNPTAVVWSVEKGVLSTISLPTLSVINSITLQNIFTTTIMDQTSPPTKYPDGWQLQVFNSGPLAGMAVLLSQYDQVLVYVNLANMTVTKNVDLTKPFTSANPPQPVLQSFRIGKDEADGSIVVAFADPVNGKTVLYNVDSSGTMTHLSATASFLATGLQESADGTQIYWGNRSSFAITPKQ